MPFFSYRGRNNRGDLIEGSMESQDSATLAGYLASIGITPLHIRATAAPRKAAMSIQLFEERIQTLDIMMFSRQMYTLLKAGIPIMRALSGLQGSTTNKRMAAIIGDIRISLDGGRELSAAMRQHPRVFSSFYVSMIRVGETTGMLEQVFLRLYDHLQFEKYMRDQIRAALRYPSFVIIAMAVAIAVVNLFVIPAFADVFASFGAELPLITRGLLGFSGFMVVAWPYLILVSLILVMLVRSYIATPAGRYQWDSLKFKLPIAGKIIHMASMARFSRSFALASKSGVPIVSGLGLVIQTMDNSYISRKVEQMRAGVERGESISRTAAATGVFSSIVMQMISVGEESGALDDLMEEIADMYQRDVEYQINTLGAQIEPILIVFLGIMVLLLALGIFLPIWDIGSVALHSA
ncbi:type II secretion system F family protein [Pseudomethylobacillus aquaticus]|uniref:Type II secretion system F family protein n=1 Tax=Pseudomethylobacillus aquaticus TaxID=2676064 RepID=A0A3N0V366_9PROT|nr:type II secretion system F family protein [Pseudomethylobacillus aquaticus]ROH87209.1 type II secretion system F family protein [Pseudomethylobacillus aquaticus]